MFQQLTQTFNGIWSSKKNLVKITEAATGGVLWKKVFLKISQILQENTCAVFFLINWQIFWPAPLWKRDSNASFFSRIFGDL